MAAALEMSVVDLADLAAPSSFVRDIMGLNQEHGRTIPLAELLVLPRPELESLEVPTTAHRHSGCLLDHLVGVAEQCQREDEPERLGSFHVDGEF